MSAKMIATRSENSKPEALGPKLIRMRKIHYTKSLEETFPTFHSAFVNDFVKRTMGFEIQNPLLAFRIQDLRVG